MGVSNLDNWNKGREDAYHINTKELVEELRKFNFHKMFSKRIADQLDYTPESLKFLEYNLALLSEAKKGEDPPVTFVLTIAYYFGETLVRNVPGAQWHEEMIHDIRNLSIRIKQNIVEQEFKPVARILNLLMDPNRYPLSTVYETMMAMVTGEVDVVNAPEDQKYFYDKNGEYLFRVRHAFTIPAEERAILE